MGLADTAGNFRTVADDARLQRTTATYEVIVPGYGRWVGPMAVFNWEATGTMEEPLTFSADLAAGRCNYSRLHRDRMMTTTVNPATGEVAVELGGQTFRLRAAMRRVGELETQLGVTGLAACRKSSAWRVPA